MKRMWLVALAGVLVVAQTVVLVQVPGRASAYSPHGPIDIGGDADFTPANGVTRGSGTAADPYVIEGWDIDASTADGIRIMNTNAHFIVQDVNVHSGSATGHDGVRTDRVANGLVRRANVTDTRFGIFLTLTNDTAVADNVVTSAARGIETGFDARIEIRNNTVSSVSASCIAVYGLGFTVAGNAVHDCGTGILLDNAERVAVDRNVLGPNLTDGIAIALSTNVTVSQNRVRGSVHGFNLEYNSTSNDIVVTDNEFRGNAYGGYFASASSSGGIAFLNNTVADNGHGAYLDGATGVRLVHNDFLNNTVQAFDAMGPENSWDDGCNGGNYWSDYAGADATDCATGLPGSDGIGDTPYVIDPNSADYHPLKRWWGNVTNSTPPTVVLTSPVGGEDWTGGSAHDITYTTADPDNATLDLTIQISLDDGASWSPEASFPAQATGGHGYAWTVPIADTTAARVRVCASDRVNPRACATSWPITIDSTPPRVPSASPGNGATDVPVFEPIAITFSEPMDRASVLGAVALTPAVTALADSWSGSVLTITHDPFAPCTVYTLTVGATAKDASDPGNPIVAPVHAAFRTACVPPPPEPPVALAVVVDRTEPGAAVTFDGTRSTGNISSYMWTVTDDANRTVGTLEGRTATFTFPREGRYTVTLRVTDASTGLSGEDRVQILVVAGAAVPLLWPVVLGVSALLIALAIVLGTEVGAVPILTILLAAVNRRKFEEGEDKVGRGMVLGYILVNPGDHYTDIKRNLGMNNGPLSWHLNKMEKEGLIKSRTEGTHRCYYPAGVPLPEVEDGGDLHAIERRLLNAVRVDPGRPVGMLAEEMGVSPQLALYHVRKLSNRGLVTIERRGLHLRIYAGVDAGSRTT